MRELKRNLFLSLFCFAVFLLFVYQAFAIGVRPSSVYEDFKPFLEKTIEFTVRNSSEKSIKVSASLDAGDLASYFSIDKKVVELAAGTSKKINVSYKFPEKLDFVGKRVVKLTFREMPLERAGGEGATISAATAIRILITINVPCKGYCMEINKFQVKNWSYDEIDRNGGIDFLVGLHNLGNLETSGILKLEVLRKGEIIFSKNTEISGIGALGFVEETVNWDIQNARDLELGEYQAKAEFIYSGELPAISQRTFLIGKTIMVGKVDYRAVEGDSSVKVKVVLNNISETERFVGLRGQLLKEGEVLSESPSTSLTIPAESSREAIIVLLDFQSVKAGNYDLELIISYDNIEDKERKGFKVLSPEEAKKVASRISFPKFDFTTVVLMGIVVALVLIVVFVFMKRRKKEEFVY